MSRTCICIGLALLLTLTATAAFAQFPLTEDWGYAGYRPPEDSRAVRGVKPAMTVGLFLIQPRAAERAPQRPWLKVMVDGRRTSLGPETWVLNGALMMPVTAAYEFGLDAWRSPVNMNVMTLSGGGQTVTLVVGSRQAKVGGGTVLLDAAPCWHNGKVYMPVESIGAALGWTFAMDKSTGTLSIRTAAGPGNLASCSQTGGLASAPPVPAELARPLTIGAPTQTATVETPARTAGAERPARTGDVQRPARTPTTTAPTSAAEATSRPGTVGLTSEPATSDAPTLKIVNKAGQQIVVGIEGNGVRQVRTLGAGESVSLGDVPAGEYRYAISFGEMQLVTGSLRLEGKRAYTWNIPR